MIETYIKCIRYKLYYRINTTMSESESEYRSDDSDNESETDIMPESNKKKIVTKNDLPDLRGIPLGSDDEKDEDADDEDDEDVDDLDEEFDEDADENEIYKDAKRIAPKKNTRGRGDNEEIESDNEEPEAFHLGMASDSEYSDDDDDDDVTGGNYLEKFDESTKKNIIEDFHPELFQHNYQEIDAMTTVVRDQNGSIVDPIHRTLPFLTKYEKTRILGERTKQLNAGAKPFIAVNENVIDGYLIALKELEEKRIPFIIKRPLSNGGCEYWKLKDLEILS